MKYPDGIDPAEVPPNRLFGPGLRFAVLGILIGAGLLGVFGGGPPGIKVSDAPAADFRILAHDRLRNGNMYEVRFTIAAKQPIADAVVAVPAALLRDITVNSLTPAPEDETFANGEYRFHLGAVAPGRTTQLKIDGQINPSLYGRVAGVYRLLDGDREIARVPAHLWVIP